MYPSQHILLGVLASLSLYLLFPQVTLGAALIILASSVLIDVDHYFYYVVKKKEWSLRKAYVWFDKRAKNYLLMTKKKRKAYRPPFFIFHGVEWVALFLILTLGVHPYFFFIAVGMMMHLASDVVDHYVRFNEIFWQKVFVSKY